MFACINGDSISHCPCLQCREAGISIDDYIAELEADLLIECCKYGKGEFYSQVEYHFLIV